MLYINYSNSFFNIDLCDLDIDIKNNIKSILKNEFTFYINNFYINKYSNTTCKENFFFLYKSKVYIYSGLLNYFLYKLSLYKISYEILYNNISDLYIKNIYIPEICKTKYILRKYQKECLYKIFEYKRGICNVATGGGKTLLQGMLICNINNYHSDSKTLSLFASKDSLIASHKYFEEMGIKCSIYPIVSQNTLAITSVIAKQLNAAKKYITDCLLLQIDECQSLRTAKTVQKLVESVNADYKIGWSGTPLQCVKNPYKNSGDMNCIARLGDIIYTASRSDLTQSGTLNDVYVVSVTVPYFDNTLQDSCNYTELYTELILKNEQRNNMIVSIVDRLIKKGYKPLVIIKNIKHGTRLLKKLAKYKTEFVSGNNTSRKIVDNNVVMGSSLGFKDRLANDLDCGIGSAIFGQSFDCPEIDVVVDAAGGNTFTARRQRLGRVIRKHEDKKKESLYILLDDSLNHNVFKKHYKETCKFFKNDGIKILSGDNIPEFLGDL